MQEVFVFILVGVLGGLLRSLYGFMKAVNSSKKINLSYFLSTVIIAGIIGGVLGNVFNIDYRIAALAGYAGTDILENIYKGLISETIVLKK